MLNDKTEAKEKRVQFKRLPTQDRILSPFTVQ